MRKLALIFGLTTVMGASAFACGDDVTSTPPGGGSGGEGGDGGTIQTNPMNSSSSGMTENCDGPFDHVCDAACCNVEVTCGFSGTCQIAAGLLGIDFAACTDPQALCAGACLENADCLALASLAGMNWDPDLAGCLAPCLGDCLGCVGNNCGDLINQCAADPGCQGFIQCAAQCAEMDGACINMCAAQNPGQVTDDLITCGEGSCTSECGLGAGGGGGTGGNGGGGGN